MLRECRAATRQFNPGAKKPCETETIQKIYTLWLEGNRRLTELKKAVESDSVGQPEIVEYADLDTAVNDAYNALYSMLAYRVIITVVAYLRQHGVKGLAKIHRGNIGDLVSYFFDKVPNIIASYDVGKAGKGMTLSGWCIRSVRDTLRQRRIPDWTPGLVKIEKIVPTEEGRSRGRFGMLSLDDTVSSEDGEASLGEVIGGSMNLEDEYGITNLRNYIDMDAYMRLLLELYMSKKLLPLDWLILRCGHLAGYGYSNRDDMPSENEIAALQQFKYTRTRAIRELKKAVFRQDDTLNVAETNVLISDFYDRLVKSGMFLNRAEIRSRIEYLKDTVVVPEFRKRVSDDWAALRDRMRSK